MDGGPGTLDARESTRRALKYRRGTGEIIIVNHDGRGWWDATSTAKGDVVDLVRHLDSSLNFGEVRKILRGMTSLSPSYPAFNRGSAASNIGCSPAQRWARRRPIAPGDADWRYLHTWRGLPAAVLAAAALCRTAHGAHGSAWFAYRDEAGAVSHVEVRGPDFRGSLRGGRKTLLRFSGPLGVVWRLAVLEARIDALSLATIERMPPGTLYVATGGGMGSGTIATLQALLSGLREAAGVLVGGADANAAGDRCAAQHARLAAEEGPAFEPSAAARGPGLERRAGEGKGA